MVGILRVTSIIYYPRLNKVYVCMNLIKGHCFSNLYLSVYTNFENEINITRHKGISFSMELYCFDQKSLINGLKD